MKNKAHMFPKAKQVQLETFFFSSRALNSITTEKKFISIDPRRFNIAVFYNLPQLLVRSNFLPRQFSYDPPQ